jgi:hypothetical protein
MMSMNNTVNLLDIYNILNSQKIMDFPKNKKIDFGIETLVNKLSKKTRRRKSLGFIQFIPTSLNV